MDTYQNRFQVLWADLDPNRHLRHTAYNDFAAQVRVNLFQDLGAPLEHVLAKGFGPVLFTENTSFLRKVRMNEWITVDCAVLAMRRTGKIWKFRHQIFKDSGELACRIEVDGAFLDLKARKVADPPEEIVAMMDKIPKAEAFKWLD